MGELIKFPERPQYLRTAIGRFLLALEEQEKEQMTKIVLSARRPSAAEGRAAKMELEFIFRGENKEEADMLYRQGLEDVTNLGRREARFTDAALFYAHIEYLTATAAATYDHVPVKCIHTRFNRLSTPITD